MGKVEKFVKKHEKEKQKEAHIGTLELIGVMRWYIQEMAKLNKQANEDRRNLTEAYNARLAELKSQLEARK